ncbi:UNVERIFIED_ORG: methyltransferase family protein [Anoxybacillus amylolyticus]
MFSPERTAIRTGVAQSARRIPVYISAQHSVLDYGAGKLRNAIFLAKQNYRVSVLDTVKQRQTWFQEGDPVSREWFEHVWTNQDNITETYDVILCSFVLNVVLKKEREAILCHIDELLRPNGWAFLEVRKERGILQCKHKEPFEDGFLIGARVRTFQKPYRWDSFFGEYGAWFRRFGWDVVESFSTSDSLGVVLQKQQEGTANRQTVLKKGLEKGASIC